MIADPPPVLEAVVVQPPRLPTAAGDAAFAVVQINAAELQSGRADEVLTAIPGVSLFRRTSSLGANPTTQGVSLRSVAGSGASRALVTLEGVPQNDPFGGWVIWSGIPRETLGAARIVRGAGAGPYGAGALTGVISLDERDALPRGVAGEASVGELGQFSGSAALDGEAGPARLMGAIGAERSAGWIPVEAGRRGAADTRLSLDALNGSIRALSPLGPGVIAVRASGFVEKRQAGVFGAASKAQGAAYSLTYAAAPTSTALGWRVQGWLRTSDLANTSVAVAAGRVGTTPANNQFATPATGYGLNAALRSAAGAFTWEVGGDLRASEGEVRELFRYMAGDFTRLRIAGGKTLVGGVYAEGTRTSGDWLFTGGVRLDAWRSTDASRVERDRANNAITLNETPPDRDGVVPTARAGLRRSLGGGYFARGAAYAGFRPPTLNELHRPFRVGNDVTEANAALKPERLYGVETGLGWERGPGSFQAGIFYNRLEDAIANVTIGAGPGTFPVAGFIPAGGALRQRQNAGAVKAYGVEAEGRWALADTVSVNVAAAYTHAEVDGGAAAPQLTGLRPAQTPRATAMAGVDWRVLEPLTFRADIRFEGMRFDDDLNARRLEGAATVDLGLQWRLSGSLSLVASAENLFDVDLPTAVTGDGVRSFGPPRRLRVGLVVGR